MPVGGPGAELSGRPVGVRGAGSRAGARRGLVSAAEFSLACAEWLEGRLGAATPQGREPPDLESWLVSVRSV